MRPIRTSILAAVAAAVSMTPAAAQAVVPAAAPGGSSAYGIEARGLVNLGPLPSVTHGDRSLLTIPANPVLKASVLHVTAWPGHARASVADLALLVNTIRASAVTAVCTNGVGDVTLVDATAAGIAIPVRPGPDTEIGPITVPAVGTVDITLNKQVRVGNRLTVTAIDATVLSQHLSVSSASCEAQAPEPQPKPVPEAPKPKPIKSNLPVTG